MCNRGTVTPPRYDTVQPIANMEGTPIVAVVVDDAVHGRQSRQMHAGIGAMVNRCRGAAPLLVLIGGAGYFAAFSLFRNHAASLLVFVPVALVVVWARRWREGVCVWVPLAVYLDAFARLRSLADETAVPIQHTALAQADRAVFRGTVPTVWLQARWHVAGQFGPLDYAAVALHWSHFVLPIATLVGLWLTRHTLFRRYYIAFLVLTTLVLIGYFVFPATPPWLAAREGTLLSPLPLARPMVEIAAAINRNLFGTIYTTIGGTNDVAAMPSLHAAYPCLMAAVCWQTARRLGVIGLVYSLLMSFALIYLAEHYVVDVLASAVCVLVAVRIAAAIDARLPAALPLLPAPAPVAVAVARRHAPRHVPSAPSAQSASPASTKGMATR